MMVYDSPSTLRWDAHRPRYGVYLQTFCKEVKGKLQNR
nr:MAG TPA_asm: hypothetical protein [Caudoviricetes sp.]